MSAEKKMEKLRSVEGSGLPVADALTKLDILSPVDVLPAAHEPQRQVVLYDLLLLRRRATHGGINC